MYLNRKGLGDSSAQEALRNLTGSIDKAKTAVGDWLPWVVAAPLVWWILVGVARSRGSR